MSTSTKAFCSSCGHAMALHHHPNIVPGSPCVLEGCPCVRYERQLAIDTPTNAEMKAEARLVVERMWMEVQA